MKKLVAGLLIFLFFTNMNCVIARKHNFDDSKSLATFKVTYMNDSKNISHQGEKGVLKMFIDFIQFNFHGGALEIPYNKIISVHYNEDLKRVFQNIQGPSVPLYWRQNPYSSGSYILTPVLLLIAYLILEPLLKSLWEKKIIIAVHYRSSVNDEWIYFKLPKKHFETLRFVLKTRTGLDFQD